MHKNPNQTDCASKDNPTYYTRKESSLQLHLSKLIFDLDNLYCILPGESFKIEMETNYGNKSIHIVCGFGQTKAAIELKCLLKQATERRI